MVQKRKDDPQAPGAARPRGQGPDGEHLAPEPRQATFVAFPPHLGGAWGVIGAEFAVQMRVAE